MFRLLVLLPLLVLAACATPPRQLDALAPYSQTTPQQAQSGRHLGEQVRWGGKIIQATPLAEQTCLEVMGIALERNAQPKTGDHPLGRFLACAPGFYDPVLYAAGRDITVVGRIEGIEKRKVGEYLYDFPRLAASTVYLWPKRPEVISDPYYDPFYYPPFWPRYPYYRR